MTASEIIDACKHQLYEAWLKARTSPIGDDAAAFVYVSAPKEIQIVLGPREGIVERLTSEGVDFSQFPEVNTKASENNPIPSVAIWVIVGIEVAEKRRQVYVTKFMEPLFGRMGGTVMGEA